MASRMSITTSHPAPFSAARCSGAGCPPVTIPWIGSHALGTPAMASSSWLIGMAAASLGRSIYLKHGHGVAPPSLALGPFEAAAQAVAELGRSVSHGAALRALPRRSGSEGHHPRGGPRGRVELSHLPEPHPRDGACTRRQSAGHDTRRLAPRRCPPDGGSPPVGEAVPAGAAGNGAAERRRDFVGSCAISPLLPHRAPRARLVPCR